MDDKDITSQVFSKTPVELIEDLDTGDRFLIYTTLTGIKVSLRVEGDSFWATQHQISETFGVTPQNVSIHLRNIFKEGELIEAAVCKETLHTARDGKRYQVKMYDLNALISVGYRVAGPLGTAFRMWATEKLLQYLTKGFVIDAARLKEPGNEDRIAELRETIRDIRASEANVYSELRRICSMCLDYDPKSEAAQRFYVRTQAKLYWAVTSNTPAMVLKSRANSRLPNMGLQTWPKDEIRQSDALTAKNYLGIPELEELNTLYPLDPRIA